MAGSICATCGTHFGEDGPPQRCPICEDERQYVGWEGQRWTTLSELQRAHRNRLVAEEPGLLSIHTEPEFAISQRAFLVATPVGNVLWESLSLVDESTVAAIRGRGGISAIAISHPHFYTGMVEWSRAFGGVPVWLHEADRQWVMRPDPSLRFWSGDSKKLLGNLTLVQTGGHFDGSAALHWPEGAGGKGVLFSGDLPNVCFDRRWFTFMRSYPNYIPLSTEEAGRIVGRLRDFPFDRAYGWSPGRTMHAGARQALALSLERHLRALKGEHGVVSAAP